MKAQPGDVFYAKRIGKQGQEIQIEEEVEDGSVQVRKVRCPCHMLVKCAPQFKNKLLAKKKSLAGLVDPEGFKYFVAQYLPEPFKAALNKHRPEVSHIMKENANKQPADKTPVWVIGPDLYINRKVVTSYLHPPSPAEICRNKANFGPELASFDLFQTRPLQKEGSMFQGFAVQASTLLGVSLAYTKVRITVPTARHIMCAYEVAGMKDSFDDGEDHAGLLIAKKLASARVSNVVLFVARETGPDLLGHKRFELIGRLVDELFQIIAGSSSTHPIDASWVPKQTTQRLQQLSIKDMLQVQPPAQDEWAATYNRWSSDAQPPMDALDDWSQSDQTEVKMVH